MKTTEEKRVAVLQFCDEVCPTDDKEFSFENQAMQCTIIGRHHHGIADFDIRETGYFQRRIYQIRSSDDGSWWDLYYIFLGLATRDAVDAERAKTAALVEAAGKARDYIRASLPNTIITGCKEENYYFAYHELGEALEAHKKGGVKR